MPNGRISPGFLTADAAAALSRVLERLDRLEAAQHLAPAGGLSFQAFAGGNLVTDRRPESFWARLTSAGVGTPTPWGWVESYESAPGVWADYPDGRSSGTANTPGFAAPGAAGAAGQVVRMLLSQGPAGDHYVFGPPPGVFLEDVTFQDTTVTFVNVTVVFDPTTTVTFQGETLFAYLSCFTAFDDTLSASSTNNWAGVTAAWAFQPWVRLAGNGGTDCELTGVLAPPGTDEGCSFWLLYTGPGVLHLPHQHAGSTAANRFLCPWGLGYLLQTGQCVQVRYDRGQSRYRVLSGESLMTGATSLADGAPGLVPKPLIADRTLYLDGSGDWSAPAAAPAAFSGARVYNSADITLSTLADVLTYDSERWDTDGYHSTVTNTGRLTVPADGYYRVGGSVRVDPASFNLNQVAILVRANGNGSETYAEQGWSLSSNNTLLFDVVYLNVETTVHLLAGEYVELVVSWNSTGAGAVKAIAINRQSPEFWIEKVG